MVSVGEASFDIDWSQVEAANEVLRSVGHNASRNLYPVINKALKPYKKAIRDEAPKWEGDPSSKLSGSPGDLRRSIKWKVNERVGVMVQTTHPKGAHAWLVYNAVSGWPNLRPPPYGPPNPFLHRGVGRYRKQIYEVVSKQLEAWYRKADAARVAKGGK